MTARGLAIAAVALAWAGCLPPEDTASNVRDLRVLGISIDPPEVFSPRCPFEQQDGQLVFSLTPEVLAQLATELRIRALIRDPQGAGRTIHYELFACAEQTDRTCKKAQGRVLLAQGETQEGALELQVRPGSVTLDDGALLLLQVVEKDPYFGLGGLRLPLVLHLRAGDEELFAQKLMVYNCPRVPGMTQNQQPQLPGVSVDGAPWPEDEALVLQGRGPFELSPLPFEERQETYVVPTFQLQPLTLQERWEIAWHADLGRFSPEETGGADPGGQVERHLADWQPPRDAPEREVRFWFVVRDGRGGLSWLERRALYRP
jgi:hypothetical protein